MSAWIRLIPAPTVVRSSAKGSAVFVDWFSCQGRAALSLRKRWLAKIKIVRLHYTFSSHYRRASLEAEGRLHSGARFSCAGLKRAFFSHAFLGSAQLSPLVVAPSLFSSGKSFTTRSFTESYWHVYLRDCRCWSFAVNSPGR